MTHFKDGMLEHVVETSTNLPPDVQRAIAHAMDEKTSGTQSALALDTIALNV